MRAQTNEFLMKESHPGEKKEEWNEKELKKKNKSYTSLQFFRLILIYGKCTPIYLLSYNLWLF